MSSYSALTPETVPAFLTAQKDLAARLGGAPKSWRVREVGDGNLNLVFLVEGQENAICLKQALPYVRMVGESWPLPLSRSDFEHAALVRANAYAPGLAPSVYFHDSSMGLTAMEYLSPHIILRKGLIQGIRYPHAVPALGRYMARVLFETSDLALPAEKKKAEAAYFAGNAAMCKISEDLIFDEPYLDAALNRHTPSLEKTVKEIRRDTHLISAVQEMKWRFMTHSEALLHGDLHTGSIMVTSNDTRVIDPEFAFYGPMGFDMGALMANLLLAFFAQPGLKNGAANRSAHQLWIVNQVPILWDSFTAEFSSLWTSRRGEVFPARLPLASGAGLRERLAIIWRDAVGFAGAKIIRRILGMAHVEDLEAIADPEYRASCELRALAFARLMLTKRDTFGSPNDVAQRALASGTG